MAADPERVAERREEMRLRRHKDALEGSLTLHLMKRTNLNHFRVRWLWDNFFRVNVYAGYKVKASYWIEARVDGEDVRVVSSRPELEMGK